MRQRSSGNLGAAATATSCEEMMGGEEPTSATATTANHPLMVDSNSAASASGSNQESSSIRSRCLSYLRSPDCIEFVCVLIFSFTIAFVLGPTTSPRTRPIPYQELENSGEVVYNLSLSEDLENETISDALLVVLGLIIPFVFQLVLTKVLYVKGDCHATLCAYILGFGLTSFVTEFIKNYVGYLRPNFYAMCEPNDNLDECNNTDDGDKSRRSFPSGHASLSFVGLTLLTQYLQRRFGVSRGGCLHRVVEQGDGETILHFQKPRPIKRAISVLCLSPMLLAIFISASRVVDNYHFPADVVGGAMLGIGGAFFAHGLWFPSLPALQV